MKKSISIMLSAIMATSFFSLPFLTKENYAYAATFNDVNQGSVFLKQQTSVTCTLCSATMLLRRVAMMRGDSDWSSITESDVRNIAWFTGGLYNNFTYRNMSITTATVSKGDTNALISYLNMHPEGIVIYNTSYPHAVLLTDYTDGTFYCADPANGKPYGRIPMSQALISINSISKIWYCQNPAVHFDDPTPSQPTLSVSAGTATKATTFSWNACANTDRYDLRIYQEGTSEPFLYQQTTDTSFSLDLPEGKYWANVASVNTGYSTWTFSEENHFSTSLGICEPKAVTSYNGHIYAVYDNITYYEQAKELCEKMGGHLATITSQKENDTITSLMSKGSQGNYWIGGTRSGSGWVWETGESFSYESWNSGEPNNANGVENYIEIYPTGYWNDERYEPLLYDGFILEIDELPTAKTAEYNDHIYYRFDSTSNWTEAEEYCKMLGGHLVSITEAKENEFIQSFIADGAKDRYWIGTYDAKRNKSYVWTTGESFSFAKWGETQPDCWDNAEFYAEIWKNDQWNDMPNYATVSNGFICEVEKNPVLLEIVNLPNKQEYYLNEELDLTGLSLRVSYEKGNEKIITSGFKASAELNKLGKQSVKVTYGDMSVTFNVNVICPVPELQIEDKTETSVTLSWTEIPVSSRYQIMLNGTAVEDVTNTQYTLTDLIPDTDYRIQIVAFDGMNELTSSKIKYVTTSKAAVGDINSDGKLDVSDIIVLQNHLHGRKAITEKMVRMADMNSDGIVNIYDMVFLKRAVMKELQPKWTEWSTEEPPADAKSVETRTEYRYATKAYTTSETELDSSWVLENQKKEYSDYGAWSAYQENAVESSALREVETTNETRSRVTGYHVFYYCTQWADSLGSDFSTYHARSSYGEHNSYTWFGDRTMSIDAFNSATVVPPEGQFSGGYNKSSINGYCFAGEPDYLWYQGDAVTENYDVTLYRYRDRTEKNIYTYSKLSNFSEWSETSVESSDTIVVETRTLYRYTK